MTFYGILALSISLGFIVESISTYYNYYLFSLAIILSKNIVFNLEKINKSVIYTSLLILTSIIFFNIFSKYNVVFGKVDFSFLFISIVFSYYLVKEEILELFFIITWRLGIIIWIIYILFFIPVLLNSRVFLFDVSNSAILKFKFLTGGLIYKPLVALLFLIPLFLILFANSDLKSKLPFFSVIQNKLVKYFIFIILLLILPSRSIQLGIIIYFLIEFINNINNKLSSNVVLYISLLLPSVFVFFLFSLNSLVTNNPLLLTLDRRTSVWIECINYIKENPISYFLGPGYFQVDELVAGQLIYANQVKDIINETFSQLDLDYMTNLILSATFTNDKLLGFESDFLNGILAFGVIPTVLISTFLLYKLFKIVFLNKRNHHLYSFNQKLFARIMIPIFIALFFEDRGPYIIIWILIFSALSINKNNLRVESNLLKN